MFIIQREGKNERKNKINQQKRDKEKTKYKESAFKE